MKKQVGCLAAPHLLIKADESGAVESAHQKQLLFCFRGWNLSVFLVPVNDPAAG